MYLFSENTIDKYVITRGLTNYIDSDRLTWLDAINNTKSGHVSDTPTWYDLISSFDGYKYAGTTSWETKALSLDGSTRWRMSAPNGSFGTFEICCTLPPTFTPVNTTDWYNCSCIFGCELGGTQKDWGAVLDASGNFALGYGFSTVFSSSINALDDSMHTVTVVYQATGGLKFYIDGVQSGSTISYTPGGTEISIYGIGWNNAVTNSTIAGKIHSIRIYSDTLTDEEIVYNRIVDIKRFAS